MIHSLWDYKKNCWLKESQVWLCEDAIVPDCAFELLQDCTSSEDIIGCPAQNNFLPRKVPFRGYGSPPDNRLIFGGGDVNAIR